jgi:hypothetical protein
MGKGRGRWEVSGYEEGQRKVGNERNMGMGRGRREVSGIWGRVEEGGK